MGSGSLGSDALGGRNGEPPCGLGGSDGMGSGSRGGSDGVGSGSSLDLLKLLVYVCKLVLIVKGFRLNVTYCKKEGDKKRGEIYELSMKSKHTHSTTYL